MHLLLVGKTGSGKSSLGSSLLNQNVFEFGKGMRSETVQCESQTGTRSGTLIEDKMKGSYFQTTAFLETLPLCKLHSNMFYSRLLMIYTRTAQFTHVAECVYYFKQKITEGRKTTASAMEDAEGSESTPTPTTTHETTGKETSNTTEPSLTLGQVFRIFAELSSSIPSALSRQLVLISLLIPILMIRGCSTNPFPQATCTARHCFVGEPTAVTCLFGENISASRLGVNVQMLPFNAPSSITGKDVLMCSWKKNTTTCFVEDGYSFNYNFSDRLTLEIPVATPEIAGVYKCHVASEVVSPRACNLIVTEGSESTPTPTTTHETTGKETSNTTEPSLTLGQGNDMIVALICLVVILIGLVCFAIVTNLKLYKRIMTIIQKREAEDKETLLTTKGSKCCSK